MQTVIYQSCRDQIERWQCFFLKVEGGKIDVILAVHRRTGTVPVRWPDIRMRTMHARLTPSSPSLLQYQYIPGTRYLPVSYYLTMLRTKLLFRTTGSLRLFDTKK